MIDLRALGRLEVRDGGGNAVESVLTHPKQAALLVYLALAAPREFARRDNLLGLFWPEVDEKRARGSLKQAVYALRQALGSEVFATRGDDEIGLHAAHVQCDVWTFEAAVRSKDLEQAADVYGGALLSGFGLRGCVEFDHWADRERDRLTRTYTRVLEELVDRATDGEDHEDAVKWVRRLAAHRPHSTRVVLRVMEVLDAVGDRAGALEHAARHAALMREDLEAEPSPDVMAYADRLRERPVARAPKPRTAAAVGTKQVQQLAQLRDALADRYVIERELGAGGMATVYLAHDVRHDRPVAIKVLKPELAAVIGAERFLNEIKLTANLHHPNILALHDSGATGIETAGAEGEAGAGAAGPATVGARHASPFLYYVMPYVEGESIRDKLNREKQLGVDETIKIAEGVAAALDYAHRHGVIHRDIKPENILLHDGQALVADFGIALAVTEAGGERLTETGLSLGTPEYMSPEQAMGERELTARVDIYALGVVVYEMLVGQPPHTGSTVQAIVAQVITGEPRRISEARPAVPKHVEAAVRCALAKVPADRFATSTGFAAALSDQSFSLTDATAAATETTASGRQKIAVAAVGAVALVGAFLIGRADRQGAYSPDPVARFTIQTGRMALRTVDASRGLRASGSAIDISRDGSQIAYVREDTTGVWQIYVRSLDRTEAVAVAGTEGGSQPFFSPDGQSLGFLQDGRLKKVRLAGGETTVICEVRNLQGASWGVGVVVYSDGPRLFRVPPDGGEPEALNNIVRARHPHLMSDGHTVLFESGAPAGTRAPGQRLGVFSLETGREVELAQPAMAPHEVEGGFITFVHPDGRLLASRFDRDNMRLIGAPRTVHEAVFDGSGFVNIGVSFQGAMVFLSNQHLLSQLVMVDRAGNLAPLSWNPPARYGFPRFSRDGRQVVVETAHARSSNAGDIWRIDLADRVRELLTFDSVSIYPDVSPTDRVVYSRFDGRDPDGPGRWNLYSLPMGSGEPERLLDRPGQQWGGTVTPNDNALLFWETGFPNAHNVMMVPLDGSTPPVPIEAGPARDLALAMSPDGEWVAYTSTKSGVEEIYVRSLIDLNVTAIVSSGGGRSPRWGPDNRSLFYRGLAVDSLYEVVVTTGPGPQISTGTPRGILHVPFESNGFSANYDVHPDGERFIFVWNRAEEVEEIEVLLNWFDQLAAHGQ